LQNVPDYPELALLWWQNVTKAVTGELTPQQAMDKLAREQDQVMEGFERIQAQGDCSPRLNEPVSPDYWLKQPGAPKGKLANEKPPGQIICYKDLLEAWRQGRAD
jgi:glycerol transport system substrate-binding protein